MKVVHERHADRELAEASDYYATRSTTAAARFLDDFAATVERIVDRPDRHPPLRGGFRRYVLSKFPYQIVYRVEGEVVRVYAVAHLKRRPGYWRRRVV